MKTYAPMPEPNLVPLPEKDKIKEGLLPEEAFLSAAEVRAAAEEACLPQEAGACAGQVPAEEDASGWQEEAYAEGYAEAPAPDAGEGAWDSPEDAAEPAAEAEASAGAEEFGPTDSGAAWNGEEASEPEQEAPAEGQEAKPAEQEEASAEWQGGEPAPEAAAEAWAETPAGEAAEEENFAGTEAAGEAEAPSEASAAADLPEGLRHEPWTPAEGFGDMDGQMQEEKAPKLPVGFVGSMRRAGSPDLGIVQFNERMDKCVCATAGFFAACTRLLAAELARAHAGWTLHSCRGCWMACRVRRGQCRNVDFWLEAAYRRAMEARGERPLLADMLEIMSKAGRTDAGRTEG